MNQSISPATKALLLEYQRAEATDHLIYGKMAQREKDPRNKEILSQISEEERDHAAVWSRYTGEKVPPTGSKPFGTASSV